MDLVVLCHARMTKTEERQITKKALTLIGWGFFIAVFRVATTIKNVATQCAARSMDCQIINDDKQAHHIPRLRDCWAFFYFLSPLPLSALLINPAAPISMTGSKIVLDS